VNQGAERELTLEAEGYADRGAAAPDLASPSAARAWCYLVWLCWQRQARARQMVWIALGLLGFTATLVALNTAAGRWTMGHWRWFPPTQVVPPSADRGPYPNGDPPPGKSGPTLPPPPLLTYEQVAEGLEILPKAVPWPPAAAGIEQGYATACRALLERSDFFVFSRWVVFSIFLSFLMPIWSLSFATEALGGEREGRSLVWLLTRPLPRSSVYLAKFVALLPWALGLNLGGFALLCALAGRPGPLAFRLYWPAVLWGTLAFCALFHLMAACVHRAAVVGLVYSFFLETILGNMPGLMKRMSISFYTRCMMFDAAEVYGVQPEKPSVYLPVSGVTAFCVLVGITAGLLALGMVVFARSEYQDLT
jgi:ABC-type transport system involved in multi-copper enzyme maturation permease subunit